MWSIILTLCISMHLTPGCEFSGSNDDITAHVQTCGYRGLPRSWSLKDTLDQVSHHVTVKCLIYAG